MKKSVLIHATVWILYISFLVVLFPPGGGLLVNAIDIPLSFVAYAGIFYANALFIFPKYKNDITRSVMLLLLLFLVTVFYMGLLFYKVVPAIDSSSPPILSYQTFVLRHVWWFLYYSSLAFGYWIYHKNLEDERKQHQLREKLLEAELSFLKSQFNPHFLYNTLNYIYSRAYPLSNNLAHTIMLLSNIMRYSLRGKAKERVPLEEEVLYLQNFIEIYEIRFDNRVFVEVSVEGEVASKDILPLLLISFVENAFKHGHLNKPEHPLVVRLVASKDEIYFTVKNKKRKDTKELSTGIGTKNVRKRLELAYPNKFELDVQENSSYYTINLTLKE